MRGMESLGAGGGGKRERPADMARAVLERLAQEQNELLGEDLVGSDGRLKMESFGAEQGGHLSAEQVAECQQRVNEKELSWSPLMSEQSRDFHVQKYGLAVAGRERREVDAELMGRWRSEREVSDTALAEVAATAALARALKSEFAVVRSAVYDDYEHGVDQLIVHRGTGEVVAAFDEVTESADAARKKGKHDKVLKLAQKGGTQVTFGIGYSGKQVVRRSFAGIPVFALTVAKGDARDVLAEMSSHPESEPGERESAFVGGLLKSLQEQQQELVQAPGVPQKMQQTLASFGEVMKRMAGRDSVSQRAAA